MFALQSKQLIRCDWKSIANNFKSHDFILLSSTELEPQSQGLKLNFDEYHFLPNFDAKELQDIINKTIEQYKPHYRISFITNDEYCLHMTNILRKEYALSYMDKTKLDLYTDKAAMKKALLGTVKIPQYYVLKGDHTDIQIIQNKFTFPIIGKPVQDANNRGVKKLNNIDELKQWMDENKNKRKEVEEYIEGELYHCNSYCDLNSNIHILLSGRYLNPCLDFSSGKAIGSIFLPESSKYYNLIKRFNADVIKSLGCIQKTVFHLEFFITPKEELVFLEIAARAPGGLLSKAATHSLGVDIEAINFNFQIDANHYSPKLSSASGNYAFWCWVPKQLGKLQSHRQIPMLSQSLWEWYIDVGETITSQDVDTKPACGIVASNKNFDALYKDFLSLKDYKLDIE